MAAMQSNEIRSRFLAFFKKNGHAIIPSASLVPENDPSVLFNTAGMQPLVPYLLGEPHPQGKRLVNIQKCVRTGDIDDIGDNTHATFFEMMGNWSLGDYFKKEAINWSYELLTNKEEGFGLDPNRLYVTCFEGNEDAPRDEEAAEIWREIFAKNNISGNRIFFLPAKNNWWSAGDNGPCGPDTEMFYDVTGKLTRGLTHEEFLAADDKQEVVEIWNDVFMEYLKKDGKVIGKLEKQNVDTGSGFERVATMLQGKTNIFDTDIFAPVMGLIKTNAKKEFILKSARIIADHLRTATFMIADGVVPSNKDQGYILRRLMRRAIVQADKIGLAHGVLLDIRNAFAEQYKNTYSNLVENNQKQQDVFKAEIDKFAETLEVGLKEFAKGTDPFVLATSYGFPIELTKELATEAGKTIDLEAFNEQMKAHQELSRAGSEKKFKGGLGGESEQIIKYHTATHLLNQALHDVLGDEVSQKGSNITDERLRFDFAYGQKMTDEQKAKVEEIVNQKIKENLPVQSVVLPKAEAEATGARHAFGDKYGDMVTIYFVGNDLNSAYSKEFCGGPHVTNTGTLGNFKIAKEEAVSAGVRRIKAVLE